MRKAIFLAFIAALLAGCGTEADNNQRSLAPPMKFETKQRFEVTRIQVFEDMLAYDSKRGIYVIKDNETGKSYFGMSGVGISELGSHNAGKAIISDER